MKHLLERLRNGGGEVVVTPDQDLYITGAITPALLEEVKANKTAIIATLNPPPPPPMPPMPKSVRACLDFVERTHGKRELTAGLRGWLDKEWSRIERYERAMEVDYDRKTAS